MDMTGVQLNITKSGTGTAVCGNGQKSEIRGNKGLCGENLEKVEKYFADPKGVTIQFDSSCSTLLPISLQDSIIFSHSM